MEQINKQYFISDIKDIHISHTMNWAMFYKRRKNSFDIDHSLLSEGGYPKHSSFLPNYIKIINDSLILFLRSRFGNYEIDDYNLTIKFEDVRDYVEYQLIEE